MVSQLQKIVNQDVRNQHLSINSSKRFEKKLESRQVM